MRKRLFALFLLLTVLLAACTAPQTTPQTQPTKDTATQILSQRRDAAEAYMRQMATLLWRAQEDITYCKSYVTTQEKMAEKPKNILSIKAGRLYRGIPYAYNTGSLDAFLSYSTGQADGIHTISGLHWKSLTGSSTYSRIGNDCSGSVVLSWSQICPGIKFSPTKELTVANGFLRVGHYTSDSDINSDTKNTCRENGTETMYAAYAKLQKADAVVHNNDGGHVMMIVDVNVVMEGDQIDGQKSYVTVLHQTSSYLAKEDHFYDEALGEDVYTTFGVDDTYTFEKLFSSGYLPITCKALVDPSPLPGQTITDSEAGNVQDADSIFQGYITSTNAISFATITITDAQGKTVRQATAYGQRANLYIFRLSSFLTEEQEKIQGTVLPLDLAPGSYRCTLTCRLVTGESVTVRDFDFTV